MGYDPPIIEDPGAGGGGSQGPAGPTGATGPQGPTGATGPAGSSGSVELNSVTIDLSASDIGTLNSIPVEIVAAQGPGTFIVPVAASFQFKVGSSLFSQSGVLAVGLGAPVMLSVSAPFNDPESWVVLFAELDDIVSPVGAFYADQNLVDNVALTLSSSAEPTSMGSILTSHIGGGDGGTGYVIGDGITLGGTDLTQAVLIVDTVGGSGEVLTYHLTDAGDGYVPGFAGQDTTTGVGTDFALSIDSITPTSDGVGRITILYYVMALA